MQFGSRCAVVGNAGSGKSTLAKKIQEQSRAEILDLDNITWNRTNPKIQKRRSFEDSANDLELFIKRHPDKWIIEGCYGEIIERSLKYLPTLIFLDPPESVCIANCEKREWEPHKYESKADQDKLLPFLVSWVSEYYRRSGPMSHDFHQKLFDSYEGPKIYKRDFSIA